MATIFRELQTRTVAGLNTYKKLTGLTLQVVGDEAILYTEESGSVHLLNDTMHRVYLDCDRRSVAEMAAELYADLTPQEGEALVQHALGQLLEIGVITADSPDFDNALGRRDFLAGLGKVAMIPVLSSVFLPQPAEAASVITCATGTFAGVPARQTNAGLTPALVPNPTVVSVCVPTGAMAVNIVATNVGGANLQFDETAAFTATGPPGTQTVVFTSFQLTTCMGVTPLAMIAAGTASLDITSIFSLGGVPANIRAGYYQLEILHCNANAPSGINSFNIVVT